LSFGSDNKIVEREVKSLETYVYPSIFDTKLIIDLVSIYCPSLLILTTV
jgi:hypothetical protein